MPTDMIALEVLVADIAEFSKKQIESADLTGPRFGAYVKLSWLAQSGTPCFSDCQNMIDALQILRDLDEDSDVDTFYVAMTAALMECFPNVDHAPADIDAIRKMSADLRKVA